MSATVAELLHTLDAAVRPVGTVTVSGALTDWRLHRSGRATADLTTDQPTLARIRIVSTRHAAAAAAADLADAGREPPDFGLVDATGQPTIDPRWGLQLRLYRIRPLQSSATLNATVNTANATTHWPATIATIGLVCPDGGDDARADVHAHLATLPFTIIEHRVAVTGPRASILITQALDRLALDPRPDVTLLVRGGGPLSDFAPYDTSVVVSAIARHPRPVLTGLGHADTHTNADAAAHTSCITPTAAAQAVLDAYLPPPRTARPSRSGACEEDRP